MDKSVKVRCVTGIGKLVSRWSSQASVSNFLMSLNGAEGFPLAFLSWFPKLMGLPIRFIRVMCVLYWKRWMLKRKEKKNTLQKLAWKILHIILLCQTLLTSDTFLFGFLKMLFFIVYTFFFLCTSLGTLNITLNSNSILGVKVKVSWAENCVMKDPKYLPEVSLKCVKSKK